MRLARGSGVDGLSGMAAVAPADGLLWLRPLLGVRRAALRAWLVGRGRRPGPRTRATPTRASTGCGRGRRCRPLAALGLGPERLAATARAHGAGAGGAGAATAELARACLTAGAAGDLTLDPGPLRRGAGGAAAAAAGRGALLGLGRGLPAAARCGSRRRWRRSRPGGSATGSRCTAACCAPAAARIAIRREPARVAPPVPLARGALGRALAARGPPPAGDGLTHRGARRRRGWRRARTGGRPGWRARRC